ncbi:cytochrome bd-I oxidase subunit CydX [secondary endosymbiont of Heteropsylla cubana]|nr:cytochrome bd-I oxidase subunit CydX [secondary endosymbiont of Heteropsylla cubana]
MWYFYWILGTFLSCSLSIICVLTIEVLKNNEKRNSSKK